MTIGTGLFASALLVSVALALASYIGLLIRELSAEKRNHDTFEDAEE
jgi:hypothetical protein